MEEKDYSSFSALDEDDSTDMGFEPLADVAQPTTDEKDYSSFSALDSPVTPEASVPDIEEDDDYSVMDAVKDFGLKLGVGGGGQILEQAGGAIELFRLDDLAGYTAERFHMDKEKLPDVVGGLYALGEVAREYVDQHISPEMRDEVKKSVISEDAEILKPWTWKRAEDSAGLWAMVLMASESLPSMGLSMGAGAGAGKTLVDIAMKTKTMGGLVQVADKGRLLAARGAPATHPMVKAGIRAEKLQKWAGRMTMGATVGASESMVEASSAFHEVKKEIQTNPEYTHEFLLENSPHYKDYFEATDNLDMGYVERVQTAKEHLADAAGTQAGMDSGMATFVLSSAAGAALAPLFVKFKFPVKPLNKGKVLGGATTAVIEGAQEFGQGGAQALATNVALRDYADPTIEISKGVVNSAVIEAFAGAGFGGAIGVIGTPTRGKQKVMDEQAEESKQTTDAKTKIRAYGTTAHAALVETFGMSSEEAMVLIDEVIQDYGQNGNLVSSVADLQHLEEFGERRKKGSSDEELNPEQVGAREIVVDTPAGEARTSSGIVQPVAYGRIRGSMGADRMEIDIHMGETGSNIYVIEKVDENGEFEQHKVMYGFATEEEAIQAFRDSYDTEVDRFGKIIQMDAQALERFVETTTRAMMESGEERLPEEGEADFSAVPDEFFANLDNVNVQEEMDVLPVATLKPEEEQAFRDAGVIKSFKTEAGTVWEGIYMEDLRGERDARVAAVTEEEGAAEPKKEAVKQSKPPEDKPPPAAGATPVVVEEKKPVAPMSGSKMERAKVAATAKKQAEAAFTEADKAAQAVTKGHDEVQGGLRGHSVGGTYPYMVVGVGKKWAVQTPDGKIERRRYGSPATAEKRAAALQKESQSKAEVDVPLSLREGGQSTTGPYEPVINETSLPDGKPSIKVDFVHRSTTPNLQLLEGTKAGTSGVSRQRSDVAGDRIYIYAQDHDMHGQRPARGNEGAVRATSKEVYSGSIDGLYDMDKDPDGIRGKAKVPSEDHEAELLKKGYTGWYMEGFPNVPGGMGVILDRDIAAMYHGKDVKTLLNEPSMYQHLVAWETVPGEVSPLNAAASALTQEELADFHANQLLGVIIDRGIQRDLLAQAMGLDSQLLIERVGGFQGKVMPSMQVGLTTDQQADLYAYAIKLIYEQDAVPWMHATKGGDKHGVVLTPDETPTPEQLLAFQEGLELHVDAYAGFTIMSDGSIAVGNFAEGMSDEAFNAAIEKASDALPYVTISEFDFNGEYRDQDQAETQRLLEAGARTSGSPNLLQWVHLAKARARKNAKAYFTGLSEGHPARRAYETQELDEQSVLFSVAPEDFQLTSDETPFSDEPFFSALVATVNKADGMPKKGAAQIKRWLQGRQKKGDFKQEEVDWMGLYEFLDDPDTYFQNTPRFSDVFKIGKPVTREAVKAFVRRNQVRIVEVPHGRFKNTKLEEELEEARSKLYDFMEKFGIHRGTGLYEGQAMLDGQLSELQEWRTLFRSYRALNTMFSSSGGETSYGEWTLEGGSEYRELLLTLPLGMETYKAPHFQEDRNIIVHVRFNNRTDINGKKTLFLEEVQSDLHQAGRSRGYAKNPEKILEAMTQWNAPLQTIRKAWDDLNTKYPAAEPTGDEREAFDRDYARVDALKKDFIEVINAKAQEAGLDARFMFNTDANLNPVVNNAIAGMIEGYGTMHEAVTAVLTQSRSRGVPDAPFKKVWPLLAMKRMIRFAAEHGYDNIAWTTGEQQNKRYDLATHLERLVYDPSSGALDAFNLDGENSISEYVGTDELSNYVGDEIAAEIQDTIDLAATDWGMDVEETDTGEDMIFIVDPNGDPVRNHNGDTRYFEDEEEAEEHIKDELIGHIEIDDLDHRIGGEGMIGFYDKMLPREVNKFVKKWGGRVNDTAIETDYENQFEAWGPEIRGLARGQDPAEVGLEQITLETVEERIRDKDPDFEDRFMVGDPAETGWNVHPIDLARVDPLALWQRPGTRYFVSTEEFEKEGGEGVWNLDITPQMREASKGGFAMFSLGPDATAVDQRQARDHAKRLYERKNWMRVNSRVDAQAAGGLTPDEIQDAITEWTLKGVQSKYFKRWFGDSKTVDGWDQPIEFFHGSPSSEITEFDPKAGYVGRGFISLSTSAEFASLYSNALTTDYAPDVTYYESAGIQSTVYPNYVRASRLFDFRNKKMRRSYIRWLKSKYSDPVGVTTSPEAKKIVGSSPVTETLMARLENGDWSFMETKRFQEFLQEREYDAFYMMENGALNIGVFDPRNIKSSTGNAGTFSQATADTVYSLESGAVSNEISRRLDLYQLAAHLERATTAQSGPKAIQAHVQDGLARGLYSQAAVDAMLGRDARGRAQAIRRVLKAVRGKSITQRESLSVGVIQQEINRITEGWANPPDISVHADYTGLPYRIRQQVEDAGYQNRAEGLVDPQDNARVHIIANNIGDIQSLHRVFTEESLGHHGLRGFFGPELDTFLADVLPSVEGSAGWDNLLKTYTHIAQMLQSKDPAKVRRAKLWATEELIAKGDVSQSVWEKFVSWVRAWMRGRGLITNYTENDLRRVMSQVHARVIRGTTPHAWGARNYAPARYGAAPYSLAYSISEPPPFTDYAEEYPPVAPPTKETDKTTGKAYKGKGTTALVEGMKDARKAIMKVMDQEGYDPYFNVSDRYDVDSANYPMEGETATESMPMREETKRSWRKKIHTRAARNRLQKAYDVGVEQGFHNMWYAMGQLEFEFVKEYGEDEGRRLFRERFVDAMAATTAGNKPQLNFIAAMFANYQRMHGQPLPAAAWQAPFPVGGPRIAKNMEGYQRTVIEGTPLSPTGQPKGFNFSANFMGYNQPATIDIQITRLISPERDAPEPGRYGIYEELLVEMAEKNGVSPREFQEVAWGGVKYKTEGYIGTPMIEVVNQSIERTHQLTGMAKEDIVRSGIVRSETPMYALRRPQGHEREMSIINEKISRAHSEMTVLDRVSTWLRDLRRAMAAGDFYWGLKQGILDDAAVIERYERELFGDILDASISPYKAMHTTKNLSSVMAAIAKVGIPEMRDGVFQPVDGHKGFIEIFRPLYEHPDGSTMDLWEGYAAARRASQLIQQQNKDGTSREKLFTQDEITDLLALGDQYPEFALVFDEWQTFNKQLLDLAVDQGVLSEAERDAWADNDYIPFFRAMEEIEGVNQRTGIGTIKAGVAGQESGIKRLHGSEKRLGNLTENMWFNTASLIDKIYKNHAMSRVVDMLEGVAMEEVQMPWEAVKVTNQQLAAALKRAGLITGDAAAAVNAMSREQRMYWNTIFRRVRPTASNVVGVMREGKLKYYEIEDEMLLSTLQGMGAEGMSGMMKAMGMSKSLLTRMVTLDPAFMLANWTRDTVSAWVTSDANFIPVLDSIRSMGDVFKEQGSYLQMMMSGAGGGGFYDLTGGNVTRVMKEELTHGGKHWAHAMWTGYLKIGAASENSNRLAIANKILAKGGTTAEAMYQAQDIMNFTMSGDYNAVRFLVRVVPFLNARLQGMYRLARGARDHPVGFTIKGLALMGATLALLARNWDDDDYERLEGWQKDTNYNIFTDGMHYAIPKPFEVGLIFSTVPERLFRSFMGRDDLSASKESIARGLGDTLAFNPLPQLFKPMVEQFANYNTFLGRDIVNMSMTGLEYPYQATPWTSQAAQRVGGMMPGWTGKAQSPLRIEHLVRAYTGTMGLYTMNAVDWVIQQADGDLPPKPARRWYEKPVLSRFIKGDPKTARYNKYTQRVYDVIDESNKAQRTFNMLVSQGKKDEAREKLMERAPLVDPTGKASKGSPRKALLKLQGVLRDLNTKARAIELHKTMTPEEKRAKLDLLQTKRHEVLNRASGLLERIDAFELPEG